MVDAEKTSNHQEGALHLLSALKALLKGMVSSAAQRTIWILTGKPA
jgi:hypothetical protein